MILPPFVLRLTEAWGCNSGGRGLAINLCEAINLIPNITHTHIHEFKKIMYKKQVAQGVTYS